MKSAPFAFFKPSSVSEASGRLAASGGGAVAIAGGQSLMPLLALRVAPAEEIVDLSRLSDLKRVEKLADGGARIGAGITHAAIEDGHVPDVTSGLLRHVARGIAYRSVRHHGTIGGSVAMADPAADWPACLLALGASARITGTSGDRVVAMNDLLEGAYTTTLRPGEVITAFDVPALPAGARWSYQKVVRKSGAFAMSIGCAITAPGSPAVVVLGGTTTRAHLMAATAAAIGGGEAAWRGAIERDLAVAQRDADAYVTRLHTATVLKAMREVAG